VNEDVSRLVGGGMDADETRRVVCYRCTIVQKMIGHKIDLDLRNSGHGVAALPYVVLVLVVDGVLLVHPGE